MVSEIWNFVVSNWNSPQLICVATVPFSWTPCGFAWKSCDYQTHCWGLLQLCIFINVWPSNIMYIVNKESRKEKILELFLGGNLPMQISTQSTNSLCKTAQSNFDFFVFLLWSSQQHISIKPSLDKIADCNEITSSHIVPGKIECLRCGLIKSKELNIIFVWAK